LAAWSTGRERPAFSFLGSSWSDSLAFLGAGWSLVAAAVLFSTRRTRSSVSGTLVALAVLWFVAEFDGPGVGSPLVFTAGLLLATAFPALVTLLMFGYPTGRIALRRERATVVLAALAAAVLGPVSALWFRPASNGCTSCARNLAAAWDDIDTVARVTRVGLVIGSLAVAAAVCCAVARVVGSSNARRRLDAPILVPACVCLGAVMWVYLRSIEPGLVGAGDTEHRLWLTEALALSALSIGVIVAELRLRRTRSTVAGLVVRLDETIGSPLRDRLARALGTSDLDIVYPQGDGRYVGADGHFVDVPAAARRSATKLSRGGATVAVILHPPGVLDNVAVVEEVGHAARVALDNERLNAELRAQELELQASRVRIVDAGDAERRRLERDLHDGAQQRLIGLLLASRFARAKASPAVGRPTHACLDRIDRALQVAVDELRAIADGIHPAVLTDEGLGAAVDSLADVTALEVGAMPTDRFAAGVEIAAYHVVVEAARSGPTSVTASRRGHTLVVDITTVRRPELLLDLEDRIGALSGSIVVDERSGAGVRLHVELPCAS